MRKLLALILLLAGFSAAAQQGSLSQSVYKSRVNDTTSVAFTDALASATASGYGYMFYNNQATNPHYDVWIDGVMYHVFNFAGIGGGAAAGHSYTGNHTLALGDVSSSNEGLLLMNNSSAATVTLPTDASVDFPDWTAITIIQGLADSVTLSHPGVTVGKCSTCKDYTRGQYTIMQLMKTNVANTWVSFGTADTGGGGGGTVVDATPTVKGIAKLFSSTGSGTDGAMDQNTVTGELDDRLNLDGTSPMTGNLNMNSHKITGLSAATTNGDAVRYEQLPASASSSTAGITKLYTSTGSSTDGAMDRNSITNALATKQGLDSDLTTVANLGAANYKLRTNASGTAVEWVADTGGGAVSTTGTSVAFAVQQIYGSSGTPETGNITLNTTGLVAGITQLMIHNNSSAPTFSSPFKIISGVYITGVANYIMFYAVSSTVILVTISHEI